ncbi:MAG: hypothetical protein HFH47_00295, partial [Bacilli bacterium]|nr:hypothetical protein [Bacilli bacterium]
KAKITYLKVPSSKDSTKIKGVRYIKDCINGNTANTSNHWTELQAINNGINVAKDKNVTGTSSANANYPYSRIVDGIMDETNLYAAATGIGTQCIIVDLGKEYDLEEIAVWHYYDDGRKYYNNSIQVAGENGIYRMIDYNDALTQTSNGNRIKNDNMLSVQDKNINIGYTRGGSIKLSSTNDTINITDTPNSNFVYQGATLVCENKNTKKISNKSFNVSDCEGDITVYPTWKRNDYTWFQQNGTNNLNLWTTSSYDAYKINLTFESTYKYVRIDGLAAADSRNVFATTSKYDLTDFKTWRTTLHCYNSSGTPFTTASGIIKQWKNIKSDYPAGWDQQNYTTNSMDGHDLNISNYNGSSYYLTLHLLVNNNTFWCGWVQNLLLGDTYSYEKPF